MNPFSAAAALPARTAATVHPLPRRLLLSGSCSLSLTASERAADGSYGSLIDSASPLQLRQIHARLLTAGLHRRGFLVTKLIHACSRLRQTGHGRLLFEGHPDPDIFLFNAAIKLHAADGDAPRALALYAGMLRTGVRPDEFTIPSVIRACGGGGAAAPAIQAVHAQVFRQGLSSDVFVQNGLVAAYCKCARLEIARKMFDGLPERDKDVVSWTCVISGYSQSGRPLEALELFTKMRSSEHALSPDFVALVSLVKACADLGDLPRGRYVHGLAVKGGLEREEDLQIALMAFYAKCGELGHARALFDDCSTRPLIMWNAMISGYVKNGLPEEAVELFHRLTSSRLRPDSVTVRAVIMAAAQVGSLETATWMEALARSGELVLHHEDAAFVDTALIDMYCKCGSIERARKVFDGMPHRDVVAWSAIIAGYGLHGRGHEALHLFEQMKLSGVAPNDVTFLAALSACGHAGLVEEGQRLFACMGVHGVVPRRRHYACAVDLLARAGRLEEACELIAGMPAAPTAAAWGALLSACRLHGDVQTGALAAARVVALDPSSAGHLVQLSNLYAAAGMWGDAAGVRVLMRERGLVKASGSSAVEVGGRRQEFRCGDQSHPASGEIYQMLGVLEMVSKEATSTDDKSYEIL
ncbi:unnamed protein product [Spirodela intermedia]|uniref:Uncharacterized protein n=1 Tax=Spirodela intermedia TaxID=51605 RepID=A0A7I8L9Z9_SPIIN|nr:unnamed protein product [Spirodela intermedia]